MKRKKTHTGFELDSPYPFSSTVTLALPYTAILIIFSCELSTVEKSVRLGIIILLHLLCWLCKFQFFLHKANFFFLSSKQTLHSQGTEP